MFSSENPASFRNRLGPCDFMQQIDLFYSTDRTLFELPESDLYHWLKKHKMPVTDTDNRLRYKIWTEYEDSIAEDRKMRMPILYSGIMTYESFRNYFLNKGEKVAWLMCPPASYEIAIREGLGFGLSRMRQLLDIEPMMFDKNGKEVVNVKLAELQLKITTWMDMREHGNFTQRTEQKNLNIHATMSDGRAREMVKTFSETGSIEALENKLAELDEQEAKILNVPKKKPKLKTIDVEVKSDEPKRTDF